MALTEFLQNIGKLSQFGGTVDLGTSASRGGITSIAGDLFTINQKTASSPSFQQSSSTFLNILQGGELPETYRESVTTQNLLGLGQASRDISAALKGVSDGLQSQINSLKQNVSPIVPQVMAAEEQRLPMNGTLKDKITEQLDAFSRTLGVSTVTIGVVLAGVIGIMLIKK